MSASEVDELIRAYLVYGHTESEQDFWAWEAVTEMVAKEPASAWPLLLGLITAAPNETDLAYVAAGPLEEFLIDHGTAYLPQILIAAKSPKFLKALRGVWGKSRMAPEVRRAIESIFKPS